MRNFFLLRLCLKSNIRIFCFYNFWYFKVFKAWSKKVSFPKKKKKLFKSGLFSFLSSECYFLKYKRYIKAFQNISFLKYKKSSVMPGF